MTYKQNLNVLMLSVGFLLVFIPFQTLSNILKIILDSTREDEKGYNAEPLVGLAIVYVILGLGNFIAPSVIGVAGPRLSIVFGASAYIIYVASFFIVESFILYIASAIIGIGAAVIWAGQGTYLTQNSDSTTMGRNSGMFWAIFQCSLFIGNLYVYFAFAKKKHIDHDTRTQLYTVFTIIGTTGLGVLCLLRPAVDSSGHHVHNVDDGVLNRILKFITSFKDIKLLLLGFSFWFTGTALTYAGSIQAPAIGHTTKIHSDPLKFVGISGILFGLGEVIGGALFGILGKKTVIWGRSPIVLLGTLSLAISYVLIYLNMPDNSAKEETQEDAILGQPLLWVALICSFLLGFGDSCFQTQIYSILGNLYSGDSGPAYSVFKFVQSIGAGLSFVYSGGIGIHKQMILLIIQLVVAAFSFVIVERKYGDSNERADREPSMTTQIEAST